MINVLESAKSGVSQKSFKSQVLEAVKEEGRQDWDPSVKSEQKYTAEDRVAARLA